MTLPPPNEMTFWEHLQELRVRLIRCLVIIVAAFAITYSFPFGLQDHLSFLKGIAPLRFTLCPDRYRFHEQCLRRETARLSQQGQGISMSFSGFCPAQFYHSCRTM